MKEITLVTGNPNKLEEFREILPELAFESVALDLEEIQSLSLEEIAEKKAHAAYAQLQKPIVVEDVGFFLEHWNGLPGPFIKYFEQAFPKESLIKLLGNAENRRGYAKAVIAYYDGETLIMAEGVEYGTVTTETKAGDGFGFDFQFIPEGHSKTFSEMGLVEKSKRSHRRRAVDAFKEKYFEIFGER